MYLCSPKRECVISPNPRFVVTLKSQANISLAAAESIGPTHVILLDVKLRSLMAKVILGPKTLKPRVKFLGLDYKLGPMPS